MALSLLKNQLPGLVEKFEPEIEKALRSTLQSVKASNPDEAKLFYVNWKKLNSAIDAELGSLDMVSSTNTVTGGNILEDAANKITGFFQGPAPPTTPPELSTPPTTVEPPAPAPTPVPETGFNVPSDVTTEPLPTTTEPVQEPETGGKKKRRKHKTAKQHRKRTHRVKHKKH